MSEVLALLASFRNRGVHLWAEGDQLRYGMRSGSLSAGEVGKLREHKGEILTLLAKASVPEQLGATIVATTNPGCAIQISAGLRDAGYRATVRHVVELLDEAYAKP